MPAIIRGVGNNMRCQHDARCQVIVHEVHERVLKFGSCSSRCSYVNISVRLEIVSEQFVHEHEPHEHVGLGSHI
jgi:hypothetical protein